MIVEMNRKDNHSVIIELDGYYPYEITLTKQFSGWVFGNLLFGGIVGIAIDAISGGIYKLTPDQLHAELNGNFIAHKEVKDSHILVVLEPQPSWEKIGNLLPCSP